MAPAHQKNRAVHVRRKLSSRSLVDHGHAPPGSAKRGGRSLSGPPRRDSHVWYATKGGADRVTPRRLLPQRPRASGPSALAWHASSWSPA
jgi:hypothetical protein